MTDTDPNKKQVGGNHYKGTEFQPWDWARHSKGGIGYYEVSAIKYVTRFRKKHGVQDLEKAKHYVEKLISVVKSGDYTPPSYGSNIRRITEFNRENGLDRLQGDVVLLLTQWAAVEDLLEAINVIDELINCQTEDNDDEALMISEVVIPSFTGTTIKPKPEPEPVIMDEGYVPAAAIPRPPFLPLKPALKIPGNWDAENKTLIKNT